MRKEGYEFLDRCRSTDGPKIDLEMGEEMILRGCMCKARMNWLWRGYDGEGLLQRSNRYSNRTVVPEQENKNLKQYVNTHYISYNISENECITVISALESSFTT